MSYGEGDNEYYGEGHNEYYGGGGTMSIMVKGDNK